MVSAVPAGNDLRAVFETVRVQVEKKGMFEMDTALNGLRIVFPHKQLSAVAAAYHDKHKISVAISAVELLQPGNVAQIVMIVDKGLNLGPYD